MWIYTPPKRSQYGGIGRPHRSHASKKQKNRHYTTQTPVVKIYKRKKVGNN